MTTYVYLSFMSISFNLLRNCLFFLLTQSRGISKRRKQDSANHDAPSALELDNNICSETGQEDSPTSHKRQKTVQAPQSPPRAPVDKNGSAKVCDSNADTPGIIDLQLHVCTYLFYGECK